MILDSLSLSVESVICSTGKLAGETALESSAGSWGAESAGGSHHRSLWEHIVWLTCAIEVQLTDGEVVLQSDVVSRFERELA